MTVRSIYFKLDVGFFRHPKARAAGKDGRALYLAACLWSKDQLTDGLVPVTQLQPLLAEAEVTKKAVDRLVAAGLWHVVPGGWLIHGWLDDNKSSAQVSDIRAKRREAGAKGGKARANASKSEASCLADGSDMSQANGNPENREQRTENREDVEIPTTTRVVARDVTDGGGEFISITDALRKRPA